MPLAKFQEEFKNFMLQPLNRISDPPSEFSVLFEDGEISVSDRLKVYHNNIVGSIAEALCATFPLLENLVGKDFLLQMAREFIFDTPPSKASLYHYGAGFDRFVASYKPAKNYPYLPDVARLELAINAAYYAQDDQALEADTLSKVSLSALPELSLPLRSSACLLHSCYPLLELRAFCLGEDNKPKPDMASNHEARILIYRPKLDVEFVPLSRAEYEMLDLLHKNIALGPALERVMGNHQTFDFTSFLKKHIALETFSDLKTNT